MMIHLNTPQILLLVLYALVFAFFLSYFVTHTNDYPRKNPEQFIPYLVIFFLVEIVFAAGLYGVLVGGHYITSSVVLVSLKYSDLQSKYNPFKTELLIAEDAEKVEWYFKHRVQTPFFYEYHLLDDKNHMQIFQCTESDLLQRVKDTVVKDDKGELLIATEHPLNK